ncbi:MAG: penicillin-binding protein activator [Hyphomicrobiaceae bacterium]|nr:penicillin-binding protein activator [Hyphomicrobiaceae bacterium]
MNLVRPKISADRLLESARDLVQRCGGRAFRSLAVSAVLAMTLAACSGGNPSLTQPNATDQTKAATKRAPVVDRDNAPVSLSSRDADAPPPEAGDVRAKVKIGLLVPLTGAGQTAIIAQSLQKSAELAVADLRASHVQLIVKDDKGTPEGALAAAQELVGEGAEIVLGPMFSKSVQTASAVTRSKNIPMVAFSNDRAVAGTGVHLLSFLAGPEVQRVVSYAAAQGKKRLVAFVPDDAYGKLVEQALRDAVLKAGVKLVALETYPTDGNGRTSPVLEKFKKLRDEMRATEEHGDPIDAIFIPGGEETVQLIGPLFKQVDLDPTKIKVLGTGALDTPNAGRDPAFVGTWFATPDPKGFKDFSERYAKANGHAPPRIASLAYDATSLSAALGTAPPGARFIPSAMTRQSGFTGVDGLFRLTQEGPAERALAIMEVRELGAQVIDQAPQSFDAGKSGGGAN